MSDIRHHAGAIACLPEATRELVIDALRVRAMDFVGDRLNDDGGDEAADICRALTGRGEGDDYFNPDAYRS